jgi:hypothetical protein
VGARSFRRDAGKTESKTRFLLAIDTGVPMVIILKIPRGDKISPDISSGYPVKGGRNSALQFKDSDLLLTYVALSN